MRKLAVGISIFLKRGQASIWDCGAHQNVIFMHRLLKKCPNVGEVFLVNGGDADDPHPGLMLTGSGLVFVRPEDVAHKLDVTIEAGAQLSAEHIAQVRRHGGRAVAFKFGNAVIIDGERTLHDKPAGAIFNGAVFDEVWTNAQHMRTCGSYWETCYRAPVRCLPHLWDPTFVDAAAKEAQDLGYTFGYAPGQGAARRVAIFEPNVNLIKMSTVPMLVCERLHRAHKGLLSEVYVTNTLALKERQSFKTFAQNLDLVKDGIASFEGRFNTPYFMAKFADIVVSHQWENALNYAYYDALHGRYPLVHNSDLLPAGIGYKYNGFDAQDGAMQLHKAITQHDQSAEDYDGRARHFLQTLGSAWPDNVEQHAEALAALFDRPTNSSASAEAAQ